MAGLLAVLTVILGTGCAVSSRPGTAAPDRALPAAVAPWLSGGEESGVTGRILEAAEGLGGGSRRERVKRAMVYVREGFSYDPWLKTEAFQRTADDLFASRVLGGCSDFALAQIALFRALGVPSRMVVTCNVDWIEMHFGDGVSISEGHSFIEVYLEDRWHLVDSTFWWLFSGYDPDHPFYPHGEVFGRRGKDFWDMGIRRTLDLEQLLKRVALSYEGGYRAPHYAKHPL